MAIVTNTLLKMKNLQDYTVIPPHKYPIWIIICVALVLGSVAYAVVLLPDYFIAAKNFNLGVSEYDKENYARSIKHFESVLEFNSTSKKARIAMAKSYFANGNNGEEKAIGLSYLEGITALGNGME
jgi:hypothetical protein